MNNTGNYEDFVNDGETRDKNRTNDNSTAKNNGGIGRLDVFVFTCNAALPVEGAKVKIYTIGTDGRQNVLYEMTSGFDGETEAVSLETPNIENSMFPDNQAFAYYYVSIEHPDYVPITDFEVQVFPNTLTILPTDLQPGNGVY